MSHVDSTEGVRTRESRRAAGGGNSGRTPESAIELGDEEDTLKRESDVRRRQEFKGWLLMYLAYQSTGVIYGDIGTSPLYVFSSTFSEPPSYDDLLGALSLIIYTLTLMVTIKYVFIVLYADDEGEGGTFAIFSLISRHMRIVKRDPRQMFTIKLERADSDQLSSTARTLRSRVEGSPFFKTALKFIGVIGVSFVLADGMLTPAQSVLGAVQGLRLADDSVRTPTIVGVSCAILVVIFLLQPLGLTKIGPAFAPIIILWLLFNAVFGIYNLVKHDHSVLKAFSPYFAGHFLMRNGEDGWKSLGGILLCFTGCEALFADLGAFSRNAIRISWIPFAYPCLLLAYIGQAAFISRNPEGYDNPFFKAAPPGTFYPSFVLAVLAAAVASQAVITATFHLISQAMKLSYFPQIAVIHSSTIFYGQIYIPLANWLMMIGTVILTAAFNNTNSLGNAYGVCVILVTFITTCMVSLVAIFVWQINIFLVIFGFLVFATFDGAFLSAALTKVPGGGWLTLALAFVLSVSFILWRYGKEQQWRAEKSDRIEPHEVITKNSSGNMALSESFGGAELTRYKGMGIFFDKFGDMTPAVFIHFITRFVACPEIIVFFHLRPLSCPTVNPEDRYSVSSTPIPNCYRMVIRHGYTDEVVSQNLALLVYSQIHVYIIRKGLRVRSLSFPDGDDGPVATALQDEDKEKIQPEDSSAVDGDHEAELQMLAARTSGRRRRSEAQSPTNRELETLDLAYARQTLYIVGKEQMRIQENTKWRRRTLLNIFLWIRESTRSKVSALQIPTEQLVEVGFVKEM